MGLRIREKVCGLEALKDMLDGMAEAIAAEPLNFRTLAFIGILDGGAPIADYLARRLSELKGVRIPVAYLDITLYRDDMVDTQNSPYTRLTEIPFAVRDREIVLVDDVLFTGRTVRAALSSILAMGRPRLIRLAVAIDRGCRELPIQADFVGRRLDAPRELGIRVRARDRYGEKGVYIVEPEPGNAEP